MFQQSASSLCARSTRRLMTLGGRQRQVVLPFAAMNVQVTSSSSKMAFSSAAMIKPTHAINRIPTVAAIQRREMSKIVQFPFATLHDLIDGACTNHASSNIFGTRNGDKYDYMTYSEFQKLMNNTRTVLNKEFSINEHDKVSIISNNKVEWASIMYATCSLGAQIVPMYEAQLEKDWRYIIEDSDSKLIVVANKRIYDMVKDYPGKVGKVEKVMCIDDIGDGASYYELLAKHKETPTVPPLSTLTKDHVSFIIYTSGTTGLPKGVELSHDNIVSDVQGVTSVLQHHISKQTSLAFLPWAHVYGLTTELHSLISTGSCLAIVPTRDQILECLQMVKPTMMLSVPMLFNRVYDGVMKNIAKESPLKQKLFHTALANARKRNTYRENGQSVPFLTEWTHGLFDKLVFSKIRAKLGGNLQCMASGGAAASKPVLEFFEDINIPIMEGYGLTETAPIITVGGYELGSSRRLGCVGMALPRQEVRIVCPDTNKEMPLGEDGEICVSGPNVMIGYRNNQKANEEVFFHQCYDNSGVMKRFFRTGDQGRMIDGKFLKITGRIKEQFKLENGKYVVPAPLEDVFARGPYISQCMLYGQNHPHTVLLVVPNYIEIANYAQEKGLTKLLELIPYRNLQQVQQLVATMPPEAITSHSNELFKNEDFIHLITSELLRHSKNAKLYECPTIWMPVMVPFSPENQLMTPKLSLRRKNVLGIYQSLIDGMYAGKMGHRVHYKATGPAATNNIEM